jgi:alkaline phosphatase/alkaline phosphatase D
LYSGSLALSQEGDLKAKILDLLAHPEHSQGEMAGHMTTNSVILQSRLTLTNLPYNNDYPGCPGWACFEFCEKNRLDQLERTEWMEAKPENDYIVKIRVGDLKPNTGYYYRLLYGLDRDTYRTGTWNEFITLAGGEVSKELNLVIMTCMNYARMHYNPGHALGIDRYLGYPSAEQVLQLRPDFFVGTGDNVYYDSPYMPFGEGIDEHSIRNYYHVNFSLPRLVELFRNVGTYWEKDDHDYRYNDADTTGTRPPTHQEGIRLFKEQLPVVDPAHPEEVTYKTYRVSKELQFWLVENRDYRSPNSLPDGPDKSIWGKEQKAWLKRTLKESDAAFKILISPNPLVGPDDAYKSDNHANQLGFRHEGQEFLDWLKEEGFGKNEFFMVNGDRHWQYHSIDKRGYSEFGTGAFNDENSRMGRNPGDPDSTDPEAEVVQAYTSSEPSGGFLHVKVDPNGSPWHTSRIIFEFFNDEGEILYSTFKDTPVNQEL